ncbi:hypothetical protein PFISCL1PPCAC_17933, partial [Pristionchus fissidentatus]
KASKVFDKHTLVVPSDHPPMSFFVNRICCCSAAVTSQILSILFPIIYVLASLWIVGDWVCLAISQGLVLGLEIVCCVLVFIGCCKRSSGLIVPVMICVPLHVVANVIMQGVSLGYAFYDSFLISSTIILIMAEIIFMLFTLWAHICCYYELQPKTVNPNVQNLRCANCGHVNMQQPMQLQQPIYGHQYLQQPPAAFVNPQQMQQQQNMQQPPAAYMNPQQSQQM